MDTIANVKSKISRAYIGKCGIRGCGLERREGERRITVFFLPGRPLSVELKKEISALAAPFSVEFIADDDDATLGRS